MFLLKLTAIIILVMYALEVILDRKTNRMEKIMKQSTQALLNAVNDLTVQDAAEVAAIIAFNAHITDLAQQVSDLKAAIDSNDDVAIQNAADQIEGQVTVLKNAIAPVVPVPLALGQSNDSANSNQQSGSIGSAEAQQQ